MIRIQARSCVAAAAAFAAALVLNGCATPEPEAPPPPPAPAPPPLPAVTLNEGVAQAASIYVAFMREAAAAPPMSRPSCRAA